MEPELPECPVCIPYAYGEAHARFDPASSASEKPAGGRPMNRSGSAGTPRRRRPPPARRVHCRHRATHRPYNTRRARPSRRSNRTVISPQSVGALPAIGLRSHSPITARHRLHAKDPNLNQRLSPAFRAASKPFPVPGHPRAFLRSVNKRAHPDTPFAQTPCIHPLPPPEPRPRNAKNPRAPRPSRRAHPPPPPPSSDSGAARAGPAPGPEGAG